MITRRRFISGASAVSFSVLTSRKAFPWVSQEVRIDARPDVEIGIIRPELHGHFAEHLGSCIYGGLWVGKESQIPECLRRHETLSYRLRSEPQ